MDVKDTVTITMEDYSEYCQLLKARQVIVSIIEDNSGISVSLLLTILGGARASELYRKIKEEK